MKLNHNNLRRFVFFAYIIFSLVWLSRLELAVEKHKKVLNDRAPYVTKILEMEVSIIELERDNDLIKRHHLELMGTPSAELHE